MTRDLEIVLPVAPSVGPIRHVRGTILLSSLASMRAGGHEAVYLEKLPRAYHAAISEIVAASWLPVDVGLAHYQALEALGLPPSAQVDLGRGTGLQTNALLLGTAIRLAKTGGATPWTLLANLHRFWVRGFDGGAIGVARLGPKEARIDIVSACVCDIRYFRNVLRGLGMSLLDTICGKTYMTELPARRAGEAHYRVQWA